MPPGLVRYHHTGQFHFVTFSCYRREQFFHSGSGRALFERSLEAMRLRYDFVVAEYVVMPEHVHLLVSEPKKAVLSKALQALKLSVSVQSKHRPFWQVRMISMSTRRASAVKRSTTCIGIQSSGGWWRTRSTGHGPVTAITRPASEEPWKSSLSGLPRGGIVPPPKPMSPKEHPHICAGIRVSSKPSFLAWWRRRFSLRCLFCASCWAKTVSS